MLKYNLVSSFDTKNITVLLDGELAVASQDHPNFDAIVQAVVLDETDDTEAVARLFDVGRAVADEFRKVTQRVSVENGRVLLDGDEVDNALSEAIVRFLDEGVEDWHPLVNFLEKVGNNPQEHSREQAYTWLSRHKFTVTPEGNFLAYKGVRGDFGSVHSGPGIVDDVKVDHVFSKPGSTVEIARQSVEFNPGVGCAYGLHVGTFGYARDFGRNGKLVLVEVDPRDVVSVPTDCDAQKVRVCRYTVLREVTEEIKGAVSEAPRKVVEEDAPEYDHFYADSTVIDYVEWDEDELVVGLENGNVYSYPEATYADFTAFTDADSAGAYWNANLRGRKGETEL